jgi:hypothetical protein
MERKSQVPASGPGSGQASTGLDPVRLDRRRLLRAGAAASPVLLTLASGPVSATSTGCMVASSFVSISTFKSRNPGSTVGCASKNCEYWYGQSGGSTHVFGKNCGNSVLNGTVSTLLGTTSCTMSSWKLCDVMAKPIATSGETGVLQHLISMCLDVTASPLDVTAPNGISQTYLRGMWSSYMTSGTYTVGTTGVVWNEAQIVAWLRAMLGYTI